MNPCLGDIDPYWMAATAIDEAVRNCVAVGADPTRIAILDNFCWGNTERPETLGSLVRAALGCHDTAIAYGTPFISGKDSLNNEFSYVDGADVKRTIEIPPSLLISAIGQIEDVSQAVTMDLKEPGNLLFLVEHGTGAELGGSHYQLVRGMEGGPIPDVDLQNAPQILAAVHRAIRAGLVRSCHDLSEGGLAVALAEMAFAGGLGADVSLAEFENMDQAVLFNEANTRFLIEVPPDAEQEILEAIPYATRLGTVNDGDRLTVRGENGRLLIDESIHDLKACWQQPLAWE
jgi:phosphoribosylformylglycinamidine synthase